jgi:hypothetical protein
MFRVQPVVWRKQARLTNAENGQNMLDTGPQQTQYLRVDSDLASDCCFIFNISGDTSTMFISQLLLLHHPSTLQDISKHCSIFADQMTFYAEVIP